MYRYMTKKKARFILLIVLLAANGITGVLFSLVLSRLVDCAAGDEKELFAALAGGVAYVVFYIVLAAVYGCLKAAVTADARYGLKRDVFAGILRKSIPEFDAGNSGEYLNELSNNLNMLENVYFNNIIYSLDCLVAFAAAAAVCISVQPLMLVLMLFLAFVTLGVTKLTASSLGKSTETLAQRSQEYMQEIQDDFGGFRLIRSFGMASVILNKYNLKNRAMEEAKRTNTDRSILCSCMGQFVGLLSTVLVMAVAAWCSLRGMFSAGMVIAFGQLIGQIVSPVTAVPSIIANFRASKPLRVRLEKLMDGRREDGREELSALEDSITLEKLTFRYQEDREALRDLSFRFEAGKHYAVVGSSGSGKSTLLSLMSGHYPGYEGQILFDGTELAKLTEESRCALTGLVSQDTFLFNDTLQNNITLFGEYPRRELERAVEEAGLKEFVDSLPDGLLTTVEENGKNFSGGEKQRISLARVILRKSKVLFLDEFTANLDEKTAEEIEKRLLSRENCLMVTVTHRLNPEILRQYDEILVLSRGSLAASGTYGELLQKKALPVSDAYGELP
ncbi:MAG: ABC transporter ATP-binding protein/permease [bacterium]|nr:ABC transporter ATP-binding protein/permease [bacterium]